MNARFWISVVVMFVVTMAAGFIVHGALLAPDYAKLPSLMRTMEDSAKYFPYMMLAHLLMAFGLTWIYIKGRTAGAWLGQGVRFGLALVVLTTIPTYLIYYAVMPFPTDLVVKQILFDTVAMVVVGVVLAFVNKTT
jgi:hypothetical protein